jgi:hypothetical protein
MVASAELPSLLQKPETLRCVGMPSASTALAARAAWLASRRREDRRLARLCSESLSIASMGME